MAATSIADRARKDTAVDPQDGLFDQVIQNELLEKALERRQRAAEKRAPVEKEWKEAGDAAKGMISGLELDPGEGDLPVVIRCGRFRIKVTPVAPGHRSFDTGGGTRTTISLITDD